MIGYAWHDIAGNVGVAIILITYAALQTGRLRAEAAIYSALNAIGAGLIALSLTVDFNLSAMIVEAAWVAISAYGLVRAWRRRRAA